MLERLVEIGAKAAWLEYTGTPTVREVWMDDEDWHDSQAPLRQWDEWPEGCTHIGAKGFRECSRAALLAILQTLKTPTEGMIEACYRSLPDDCEPGRSIALRTFTAMIDHILTEHTEGED